MEQILIDFHKQIVKALPKAQRTRFDILFSQVIGLRPPAELLKGLNVHQKLVAIKRAIELLDEETNHSDSSPFQIVFTPLVKATFSALIAMAKCKSSTTSVTVAKSTTMKDSAKPSTNHNVDNVTSDKVSSKITSVEPEPKADSSKVTKPKLTRKPKGEKLAQVYVDLQSNLISGKPVFGKSAFPFVNCENKDCTFCRSLYVNFQLTKCRGHARCTKSGWYPHFGPKLWHKFSRYHKTTNGNKEFVAKDRAYKDDELLPYSMYNKMCPTQTPPGSPARDTEMEDDSHDDSASTSSTVTSASSRKRSCSPNLPKNWHDDTDGLDFSPKKKGSLPGFSESNGGGSQ